MKYMILMMSLLSASCMSVYCMEKDIISAHGDGDIQVDTTYQSSNNNDIESHPLIGQPKQVGFQGWSTKSKNKMEQWRRCECLGSNPKMMASFICGLSTIFAGLFYIILQPPVTLLYDDGDSSGHNN